MTKAKTMTDTTEQTVAQTIPPAVDTQGARRATEVSTAGGADQSAPVASEVLEKASRRSFSADYKQRILVEADTCTEPGDVGTLLRREGLYSSHLCKWRKERDQAVRDGLSKARGQKTKDSGPMAEENARLHKENQRLQAKLVQALTIIDVQKKLSALLGLSEMPVNRELLS